MQVLPKIPGYELLQSLGGGHMTAVFSARDLDSDTLCAVKILREDWQDRSTAVKLMQREARAGLAVQHRHLVRFRKVHVMRPPFFLVMELVQGESVRNRLRRDYFLDVSTALWVARQTAEALAALHRARFLHGDVKPDNIRLIDDGTAVLIDLGFAHRHGENVTWRREGYILGTVNYLAPELCESEVETDSSSDMFSLGVTLFEMLTGQLPYPLGTVEQTMRRHVMDPPADLRVFARSLPPALIRLVESLLERKPAQRPKAPAVVQQLIALEINALGRRKSA